MTGQVWLVVVVLVGCSHVIMGVMGFHSNGVGIGVSTATQVAFSTKTHVGFCFTNPLLGFNTQACRLW